MIRVPNPETLAYLAGIIDGEGSIWISRSRKSNGFQYFLNTSVYNTDRRLVDWLSSLPFPCYTSERGPSRSRIARKPIYIWSVSGREAQKMLAQIIPYSIVKQDHIQLALSINIGLQGQKVSGIEQRIRELVYETLTKLNRGGDLHGEDT